MSMLRKSWEWEKRLWWSQLVWRHSNFSEISFVLCVFKLKVPDHDLVFVLPLEINPGNHLAFEHCTLELPPNGASSQPFHQWNPVKACQHTIKSDMPFIRSILPKVLPDSVFYTQNPIYSFIIYTLIISD